MRNAAAAPRHTLSAETISLQRYIKAKVLPHTQNRHRPHYFLFLLYLHVREQRLPS